MRFIYLIFNLFTLLEAYSNASAAFGWIVACFPRKYNKSAT